MMVFETCLGAWRGRGREGGREGGTGREEMGREMERRERNCVTMSEI